MAEAGEHVSDSDGTSQPAPRPHRLPSCPAVSGGSSGGQRGSSPMPGPGGSAARGAAGGAGREDSPAKRLKLSQLQLAGDTPSPRSHASEEVGQPQTAGAEVGSGSGSARSGGITPTGGQQHGSCGSGRGSRSSRVRGAPQAGGLSRLASVVTAEEEAPAGASPRTAGSQQHPSSASAQAASRSPTGAAVAPEPSPPPQPPQQPPPQQQQQANAGSGEQQGSADAAARRSATPMDASTGPASSMVHHLSASMGGLPLGMAALGAGGACLFPPGLMLTSTNCLFQSMGGGMGPGGEAAAAGAAGPLAALMPTGAVLLCVAPVSSMLTLGLPAAQQLALPAAAQPLGLPADASTAAAAAAASARAAAMVPSLLPPGSTPTLSATPPVTGASQGTPAVSHGEQHQQQRQQPAPRPQQQPQASADPGGDTLAQGVAGASRAAAEAALEAAVAALPPNASGAQLVSHAAAIAAAVAATSCGRPLPVGYPRLDGGSGSGGNTTHGGQVRGSRKDCGTVLAASSTCHSACSSLQLVAPAGRVLLHSAVFCAPSISFTSSFAYLLQSTPLFTFPAPAVYSAACQLRGGQPVRPRPRECAAQWPTTTPPGRHQPRRLLLVLLRQPLHHPHTWCTSSAAARACLTQQDGSRPGAGSSSTSPGRAAPGRQPQRRGGLWRGPDHGTVRGGAAPGPCCAAPSDDTPALRPCSRWRACCRWGCSREV